MRVRIVHALVAALSACMLLLGATVATGAPGNGNGSGNANANGQANAGPPATANVNANANTGANGSNHSVTTSGGAGNSSAGCGDTHHSDTGHGANQGTVYDPKCGGPSLNGNGGGTSKGKPCAGCVGNADAKNPGANNGHGQMPNAASDGNNGYECDGNHGIARGNPAHTGCQNSTTQCCQNQPPCCEKHETPPPKKSETPPPPPPTGTQTVLGEQVSGSPREVAQAPGEKVAGVKAGGKPAVAPASAQRARAAAASRKLPFTGTDALAVLLAGALMLTAGLGLRLWATHRA